MEVEQNYPQYKLGGQCKICDKNNLANSSSCFVRFAAAKGRRFPRSYIQTNTRITIVRTLAFRSNQIFAIFKTSAS